MSQNNQSLSVFKLLNSIDGSDMKLLYRIDRNALKADTKLITGGIELEILKVRKI